ncbi:MAG: hypothetical protein ACI89D_002665, partial [Bermanella sp.]
RPIPSQLIAEHYGSLDIHLSTGLGLGPSKREALRSLLLH